MKKVLLLLASMGAAFACTGVVAAADQSFSFRELEYQQARDPLLPSNQSADIIEHTSRADIARATAALRSTIPAGTPRAVAEAILVRAGARCRPQDKRFERCIYSDVETRDEYVDAVRWNVQLNLAGDQVQTVDVDRNWMRS